ncbi:MAG: hypothetical protein Q4B54_04005 [Coriobacteriales bacterium]|nr:hypothetical protein [Coriobacteriales bacterium]
MKEKAAARTGFVPQSPDELDGFIKVTNPGVWVLLALCLVVLAAAFAWGVFGKVNTTVRGAAICSGVDEEGETTLYMFVTADEVNKVQPGNVAVVDGVELEVGHVERLPISQDEELSQHLIPSDYLRDRIFAREWGYQVLLVKPGCGKKYNQILEENGQQIPSDEILQTLRDYKNLSEYGFKEMEILPVTIIIRSVPPISLVFG